jgi:hypothetical protein
MDIGTRKGAGFGSSLGKGMLLCGLTAAAAWGGTVSPQLLGMNSNQPVQVIVQYNPNLLSVLLSPVCGLLDLIEILPLGELCFGRPCLGE